jgi:hypothetical protein
MIVASWLVSLDPKKAQAACSTLAAAPGREIRSKNGSRWVVLLTEGANDVDAIRRELLDVPGVQAADPVASFDDADDGRELVRWQP